MSSLLVVDPATIAGLLWRGLGVTLFIAFGARARARRAAGELDFTADLQECAVPRVAPAAEVGKVCSPKLNLDNQAATLEVGADECYTNLCLTQPLDRTVCTQQENGPLTCSSRSSTCTCRCAGDGPGPYCTCPDAFDFRPLLTSYSSPAELAGSYCFPSAARYGGYAAPRLSDG